MGGRDLEAMTKNIGFLLLMSNGHLRESLSMIMDSVDPLIQKHDGDLTKLPVPVASMVANALFNLARCKAMGPAVAARAARARVHVYT